MERPSRRNNRAPRCSSSWRMRVVTLDWTRLSLLAARTTPPASTTVLKILKDSRSIVLMKRTISHNYSFVEALPTSPILAYATRARRRRTAAHAVRHGHLHHCGRGTGGGDGDWPVCLHAAAAAYGA